MNKFCGNTPCGIENVSIVDAGFPIPQFPSAIIPDGPRGTDSRETAETYRGELFRLGRYRVAVCRDGFQWLYQRKRAVISPRGVAWNTVGYCVSRNALARLHRAYNGAEAQEISALPFHFNKGGVK